MKKVICFIVIILNIVMLCGCSKESKPCEINFDFVNYNNLINGSTNFDADNNAYFYCKSGLFINRLLMYKDGKRKTILSNNTAFSGILDNYMIIEDNLYYSLYSEETKKYLFYKYNFSTKNNEKLFETKNVLEWLGTKDHIVYLKRYNSAGLYVYDINSKTEKLVLDGDTNFCIVGDKLRYITTDGNKSHKIFEYDFVTNNSKQLGNFLINYESDLLTYNFTSDYTVITNNDESNIITVWSKDNKACEYEMPLPIQKIISGENYAYAVCYKSNKYSSAAVKDNDNGIYRVDLSNGKYEKIWDTADDDNSIYVFSDEIAFIFRFDFNFSRGFHNTVYKYDYNSKETTKLFSY